MKTNSIPVVFKMFFCMSSLFLLFLLTGCNGTLSNGNDPTLPTPTPSPTPGSGETPTPTPGSGSPTPTPSVSPTISPTPTPVPASFTVQGVYQWVIDDDDVNTTISFAAMSGDGTKIAMANNQSGTARKVYLLNTDGSGLSTYSIGEAGREFYSMTINNDGSKVFFGPGCTDQVIYKLEGGAITKLSLGVEVNDIKTTSTGEYIYFINGNDLWRVRHDGSGAEVVIDDSSISFHGGMGYSIEKYAISTDGSTIAFLLWGYTTGAYPSISYHERYELFVWKNGSIQQLTDDALMKIYLAMSGDGSTIAYTTNATGVESKYYTIKSDGTGKTAWCDANSNFVGMPLTSDGSKMIVADGGMNRIINLNGSSVLDLFPGWDVNNIAIGIASNFTMNNDGTKICFQHKYASWPDKAAVYIGYLNNATAVATAPVIDWISFSPASMPRGNPEARIVLSVKARDSNDKVTNVSEDQMLNGIIENDTTKVPAYFYFDPHDNGSSPDTVSGDGIFSTQGEPGGKINDLNQVTIRIGVMDTAKTVVVADTVLQIGN